MSDLYWPIPGNWLAAVTGGKALVISSRLPSAPRPWMSDSVSASAAMTSLPLNPSADMSLKTSMSEASVESVSITSGLVAARAAAGSA